MPSNSYIGTILCVLLCIFAVTSYAAPPHCDAKHFFPTPYDINCATGPTQPETQEWSFMDGATSFSIGMWLPYKQSEYKELNL